MLISCLVLGCSISSFVYRRQAQDPYQLAVFFILIAWAVAIGYATGASANLIGAGGGRGAGGAAGAGGGGGAGGGRGGAARPGRAAGGGTGGRRGGGGRGG